MKNRFLFLLLFLSEISFSKAQENSNQYNIVWNTQSKNASESMPCGGGDIGMNVWVEHNEVYIYVARSGSFNEDNALFKSGRIKIKLFPNPFEGKIFKQELHLQNGYVTIDGENNGIKASIKIWADVFNPIAHFDISSNKKIAVEACYENWRYQDRIIKPRENYANSYKWGAPKNNIYKKDSIQFAGNGILFYHHNTAKTIFDTTVFQQGLDSVKDQLYNPLKNLAFGGSFKGNNFEPAGTNFGTYANTEFKGWKLHSKKAAKYFSLKLNLYTAQTENIEEWQKSLDSLENKTKNNLAAFKSSQNWWGKFWKRSFIKIDGDNMNSKSWEAGRNFQLFRYMLAINAHSAWPTKFNGGLLTVDPCFTDTGLKLTPDYRNWGGGLHTAQNQRLVYFPMIKNGDWDLLQPQFDFYLRILKNAELRSKVYWNHDGACFTEQMENYGLPDFAEYGTKRPKDFDKGVEYNKWLEYEWDTVLEFCLMMIEEENYMGKNIEDKIPFIISCLKFFDEHYQYLAIKNTGNPFDENGKLILFPGSGAETFKMANNSTSTIAGLQTITEKTINLLNMNNLNYSHHFDTTTKSKMIFLVNLLLKLPQLNYQTINGHVTIAPAKSWQRINNVESPQLYPVFPWGIFGLGKPGLDTAINTYFYDTSVIKFRSYVGWKQDNIWAARLGLTDEAWSLTSQKLQNSPRRFPAFWGPGFDWVPDHNWGGSAMIGLQDMLMQTNDKEILLFPAWPKKIDVHFKLHAPYNTIVEAELKSGKITLLNVTPIERKADIQIDLDKK